MLETIHFKQTMATGGDYSITDSIVVRLAEAISAKNLESIAMKYMGIESETLENLRRQHRDDIQGLSGDIMRKWCYMNPRPDQVKVRDRYKSQLIELNPGPDQVKVRDRSKRRVIAPNPGSDPVKVRDRSKRRVIGPNSGRSESRVIEPTRVVKLLLENRRIPFVDLFKCVFGKKSKN